MFKGLFEHPRHCCFVVCSYSHTLPMMAVLLLICVVEHMVGWIYMGAASLHHHSFYKFLQKDSLAAVAEKRNSWRESGCKK